MQLRNRLLLAFVTMAFAIVSLFSVVAYQISTDSRSEVAEAFLQHLLGEFKEVIEPTLRSSTHISQQPEKIKHILNFVDENEFLVLIDNKKHFYFGQDNQRHDYVIRQFKQVEDNDDKYLSVGDDHYIWSSIMLNNNQNMLVLFHGIENKQSFTDNTIVWKRLLVTAMIILWITIWAALILSSWMARKLDSQNAKLIHQATHDTLTDLPNRSLLFEKLNELIDQVRGKGKYIALYFMDLDRFKELNDTLGHTYGDTLLKLISQRLSPERLNCELIARMGGDEFAILKVHSTKNEVHNFIRLIESKLVDPISFEGIEYQLRGSIGVAMYPSHGDSADNIIQHAEVAMYKAKDKSKSYAIYDKTENPNSVRRLKLINELHKAVKEKELDVYYQPKIDLQSNKVIGVEALVRWQHPQLGFISPVEFIPLAEQVGLIAPITHLVLEKTIHNWNEWHQQGIELQVAINISSNEFSNPTLPDEILSYLNDWNMPPHYLTLEITESSMMGNINTTMRLLQHLRDTNINLSIDDFGTGFSSFAYLRDLPITELKIDRTFIMNMLNHNSNRHIVKTIIELANNLRFKVVAEGIEDKETYAELQALGCDTAQGFYMGKPIPSNELMAWCQQSEWAQPEFEPFTETSSSKQAQPGYH